MSVMLACVMSAQEVEEKTSERFLSPTVGFGAPGASTGVDFVYRHSSGFVVLCNLNVSIPIAPMAGFVIHPELYLGYSLKRNNFYVSFAAGLWAGGGMSFYGYESHRNVHGGSDLTPESAINAIGTFGVRNDYMYLFNEKMGVTFSHTHGFGIQVGRWFLEDSFSFYTMMLKFGVTFKV